LSGLSATEKGGITIAGLPTGTLLQERYRIVKELGRGGFGAVYRAWDIHLKRAIAVKENLETSPEAQRQFMREALILANLSHPNLPRVTDHFSLTDQGEYLVMDFVDGDDLDTLIKRQGFFPEQQALNWILQVCGALEYLHGLQPPIFHRDIKPANIRITSKGIAMLVDFGLVKISDPGRKTTMGARAVSPGYAPPEQYGQGKTDGRTDIYALAATLYHLVTALAPPESVNRLVGEPLIPAHEINPDLQPSLTKVLERAMALDPVHRYQSAVEFSTVLKNLHYAHQTGIREGIHIQRYNPDAGDTFAVPQASISPATKVEAVAGYPQTVLIPGGHIQTGFEGKQHSNSIIWIIGVMVGLALLLCLGGGLGLFGYLLRPNQEKAGQTSTVEQKQTEEVQFEKTQLVKPTDAAWSGATATAQLGFSIPDWPVILAEDFDDNQNKWWTGEEPSDDVFKTVKVEIVDSVHRATLEGVKPGNLWWNSNEAIQTGNRFTLKVKTRQASGGVDGYRGVIFRKQDENNYYLFSISDEGDFTFWSLVKDEWNELISSTASSAIKPGDWNEIIVVGDGTFYQFVINGQLVSQTSDSVLTEGEGGLYFEVGSKLSAIYETESITLTAPE